MCSQREIHWKTMGDAHRQNNKCLKRNRKIIHTKNNVLIADFVLIVYYIVGELESQASKWGEISYVLIIVSLAKLFKYSRTSIY